MSTLLPGVIDFYDRHPISLPQVLDALRRQGKDTRSLVPEDLYEWDQDHYGGLRAVEDPGRRAATGGLEAVEPLARRAAIGPGARVLDVCAGLGGPARFLAHRFGARVTALDLQAGRRPGKAP